MKKLKEVIINRKKWLTPKTVPSSVGHGGSLYDEGSKKMCCLGFAMRQIGRCSIALIRGHGMPADVYDLNRVVEGLTEDGEHGVKDTEFSSSAAHINDNDDITDKQREKKLVSLAKNNGFKFTFTN